MSTPIIVKYPLDLTGKSPNNLVVGEVHQLNDKVVRTIVTNHGPFYTKDLVVRDAVTGEPLKANTQYLALHLYQEAVERSGLEVCAVIAIIDPTVNDSVIIDYQVVGGEYSSSTYAIIELLETLDLDAREVAWGDILYKPTEYPPTHHLHDAGDLYGFEYVVEALESVNNSILIGDQASHDEIYRYVDYIDQRIKEELQLRTELNNHTGDMGNPHMVTKAQVGLGSVKNYGMATQTEAEIGATDQKYMSPSTTKQAIDKQAVSVINIHKADRNNPHSVTKAQVGLGSVENLPLANQAEAEVGTSNNIYMTALRVKQAVAFQVGNAFNTHAANASNPHNVTKAQVGLGNVVNYGVATSADALIGTAANLYMTPVRVKEAIDKFAVEPLNAHKNDKTNPHGVTKAQVGLSSVQNYGMASSTDALLGTANNFYMTPLRVKEAIDKFAIVPLDAHKNDKSNPHGVTKAQVGLSAVQNYGVASAADAKNGTANNLYMTPVRVKEAVVEFTGAELNAHKNDTTNPHSVTKAQVGLSAVQNYGIASLAEAQLGTSNSFYMSPLRVKEAIDKFAIVPLNAHKNDKSNPHNVTKAQVGLSAVQNYGVATATAAENGTANNLYMTPLRVKEAIDKFAVEPLNTHKNDKSNPHGVTKAQVGLGNVVNYGVATTADAESGTAANLYMTPVRVREAIKKFAVNLLDTHKSDKSNPHNVTKAQVGLGAVLNYGIATVGEARDGTSNSVYMTPVRVKQAIDNNTSNYDARYAMKNTNQDTSLRVTNGQLQAYVNGAWRVVWPAQWA